MPALWILLTLLATAGATATGYYLLGPDASEQRRQCVEKITEALEPSTSRGIVWVRLPVGNLYALAVLVMSLVACWLLNYLLMNNLRVRILGWHNYCEKIGMATRGARGYRMKRTKTGVMLTALVFGLLANTSSALVINVGGENWEVATLTGSYDDLTAELTNQVWWGDLELAEDFAREAGGALGYPHSNAFGPFFASDVTTIFAGPEVVVSFWQSNGFYGESLVQLSGDSTYAVAVPTEDEVSKSLQASLLFAKTLTTNVGYAKLFTPLLPICGTGAFIPVVLATCGAIVVGAVAINASSAWELGQIINDPPDPNYEELYTRLATQAPVIPSHPESNAEFISSANAFLASNTEFYTILNAWRVTLERMMAAIDDGAVTAALKQYNALLSLQQEAASIAERHAKLSTDFSQLLEGFTGSISVSSEQQRVLFEQFLNENKAAIEAELVQIGVPGENVAPTYELLSSFDYDYSETDPFATLEGYASSTLSFAKVSGCNGPCAVSSPNTLLLLMIGVWFGGAWTRFRPRCSLYSFAS